MLMKNEPAQVVCPAKLIVIEIVNNADLFSVVIAGRATCLFHGFSFSWFDHLPGADLNF
jgi:hypothetical protein